MSRIIKIKVVSYLDKVIKERVYITSNYGTAARLFESENQTFIKENKGIIHHYDFEEIRRY